MKRLFAQGLLAFGFLGLGGAIWAGHGQWGWPGVALGAILWVPAFLWLSNFIYRTAVRRKLSGLLDSLSAAQQMERDLQDDGKLQR